jgi:hypothetical protein
MNFTLIISQSWPTTIFHHFSFAPCLLSSKQDLHHHVHCSVCMLFDSKRCLKPSASVLHGMVADTPTRAQISCIKKLTPLQIWEHHSIGLQIPKCSSNVSARNFCAAEVMALAGRDIRILFWHYNRPFCSMYFSKTIHSNNLIIAHASSSSTVIYVHQ